MKPLVMTEQNWAKLRYRLSQSHPKSVILSRSKMREVLGFTDRKYIHWVNEVNKWGGMGYQETEIHLDFFDEAKKTFFLLKYSDWIKKENANS